MRAGRKCPSGKVTMTMRMSISAAVVSERQYGTPMRNYKCQLCRKWHLTSQPRRAVAL